jgi:uncharacterized membrane protein YeaQ/YmgE (transglycosylase-associated protein family)
MWEHLAQMGPMLIVAGLMMGWLAEAVSRADGYGFINDMVVAIAGSAIAGGLFWMAVSSNAGMLAMLAIGCAGGVLAIVAQRTFWRSGRSGA